jgi:hypothetical protein
MLAAPLAGCPILAASFAARVDTMLPAQEGPSIPPSRRQRLRPRPSRPPRHPRTGHRPHRPQSPRQQTNFEETIAGPAERSFPKPLSCLKTMHLERPFLPIRPADCPTADISAARNLNNPHRLSAYISICTYIIVNKNVPAGTFLHFDVMFLREHFPHRPAGQAPRSIPRRHPHRDSSLRYNGL